MRQASSRRESPPAASTREARRKTKRGPAASNPGGVDYTAGMSGYWLDSAGIYVNMADSTVYCGNGTYTDCALSRSPSQVAYKYSEAAMAAHHGAMLANDDGLSTAVGLRGLTLGYVMSAPWRWTGQAMLASTSEWAAAVRERLLVRIVGKCPNI